MAISSGHSAYPKLLDSKDGNPIGVKGLPVIRVSPILDFFKTIQIVPALFVATFGDAL